MDDLYFRPGIWQVLILLIPVLTLAMCILLMRKYFSLAKRVKRLEKLEALAKNKRDS